MTQFPSPIEILKRILIYPAIFGNYAAYLRRTAFSLALLSSKNLYKYHIGVFFIHTRHAYKFIQQKHSTNIATNYNYNLCEQKPINNFQNKNKKYFNYSFLQFCITSEVNIS